VRLSAYGVQDVIVPVSVTVYPPLALSIAVTHSGNFVQGEQGATYSIVVSNGASAGPTSGLSVTETPPSGESIVSMTGDSRVWSCILQLQICSTSSSIAGGQSYPPITVTVIVDPNAASPLTNTAIVSGDFSSIIGSDITTIVPLTCTFTGGARSTAADVQMMVNEALGIYPPAFDLNGDGSVNIVDIQAVVRDAVRDACIVSK
jgi:hypothetical protein